MAQIFFVKSFAYSLSNCPISGIDRDGLEFTPYKYQNSPLALTIRAFSQSYHNTLPDKVVRGTAAGIQESLRNTWNFFTSDIRKASTWKNIGAFIEEVALSLSTVKIANTPRLDAATDRFIDDVVYGDAYSRAKYLSKTSTDILTGYIGSKGLGTLGATAISWTRARTASSFYAKAGFATESAVEHMEGIDFTKPVQTTTLKKGTVIQQWVGERGVGNYFTPLENGAAENLGMPDYAKRTLRQFVLTDDVKVLKSTASDYKGNAGGGTQYFSTELKKSTTQSTSTQ